MVPPNKTYYRSFAYYNSINSTNRENHRHNSLSYFKHFASLLSTSRRSYKPCRESRLTLRKSNFAYYLNFCLLFKLIMFVACLIEDVVRKDKDKNRVVVLCYIFIARLLNIISSGFQDIQDNA